MISSSTKRMILKFKATGCLDDVPRNGRPNISTKTTQTVHEEMEMVTGSSALVKTYVTLAFLILLFR